MGDGFGVRRGGGGGARRGPAADRRLGLAALAVRRAAARRPAATALCVLERHPLARDAGVSLVAAGSRRLVLGYGPSGVALLAELPPAPGGGQP